MYKHTIHTPNTPLYTPSIHTLYTHPLYTPSKSPVHIMKGMVTRQIAAGAKHTLAVTLKGDLWVWGHGDNGRLGNNEKRGTLLPEKVY